MTEIQPHSLLAGRKLFSYEDYRDNIDKMIHGQSSDLPVQADDKMRFLPLNLQRMKRMEKTVFPDAKLQALLQQINKPLQWIVLAEPWCGDGAQNLPVLNTMAKTNVLIDLKVLLRDSNPDIMDRYLSDGKRSIPKLVCFDTESGEELFTWGARPSSLEKEIISFKEQNPAYNHDDFLAFVHSWYARDKGKGIQEDFIFLLSKLNHRLMIMNDH